MYGEEVKCGILSATASGRWVCELTALVQQL